MVDCTDCRLPTLCDRCRDDRWMQLRGTAACRGEAAGKRLRDRGQSPTASQALDAVSDIARDDGLRQRLADEWLRWAMKT